MFESVIAGPSGAGGYHEASLRFDAVLFWNGNDASAVYSRNLVNVDFYYWLPGVGILSVLLLRDCPTA